MYVFHEYILMKVLDLPATAIAFKLRFVDLP